MSNRSDLRARALALARAALDQAPELRASFLPAACAGDATLLAQVQALLAADAEGDALLDRPLDAEELLASSERNRLVGKRIGPYRLSGEIGRGGMGAVFRAERDDGISGHSVALKLIKRGMDSEDIVRRFRQEREILARLIHPNIARLLDGGVEPDGQLWFAMEFVDGKAFTQACDDRALSLRARIELFLAVCSAVHYAHRNLVVHRDLKPGNLMVSSAGEVKLLDFGIAKLVDASAAGQTRSQVRVLTPEFAAPEQLRGEPVTTATDVYQLGLLLVEMLTGRHAPAPSASGVAPRLSKVFGEFLASDRDAAVRAARARAVDPHALQRALSGDLDRIAQRALADDATRRYESAAALADDLRRYLEDRPVLAAGDAWIYRTRKFIGRHRVGVAASVLIAASLIAGVAGVLWQSQRAEQAAARALIEAQTSQSVKTFLVDVFKTASPEQALGKPLSAREMIDIGAKRIGFELQRQPAVQVALYQALGDIYIDLGEKPAAADLYRRGLAVAAAQFADAAFEADALRLGLATALIGREGKPGPQNDEASALLSSVLAHAAADVRRAQLQVRALVVRGSQQAWLGDRVAAQATLETAVAQARALGAGNEELLSAALILLGSNLEAMQRCLDATPLFREALSIRQRLLDRRSPGVTGAQHDLALCLDDQGQAAEAESILRDVVAVDREVLGETHPDYADALNSLGTALLDERKYAEAEPVLKQALEIFELRSGADSDSVAQVANSLSVLKMFAQDHPAAIDYGTRAANAWEHNHGALYENALLARFNVALARFDSGDYAGGEAEFIQVHKLREQSGAAPDTYLLNQLGRARRIAGEPLAAKLLAQQALAAAEAGNGSASFDALMARAELARDERDLGELDAARRDIELVLAGLSRGFANDQRAIVNSRFVLAEIDHQQGHCDAALPVFVDTLKIRDQALPRDEAAVNEARFFAASCRLAAGAGGTDAGVRRELLASARQLVDAPRADPFTRKLARQASTSQR